MHISYAAMKPDPETRMLTPADFRAKLLEISVLIKETKACRAMAMEWPESHTKLWTISLYDNRLIELMESATGAAKALAALSVVEVLGAAS